MRAFLKVFGMVCALLPSLAALAHDADPLINHLDYRLACVKGKVRLEVRAGNQDWLRPSNRCGDEECRAEPACASDEGRQLLSGSGAFERLALDLACYGGRLYRRHIDGNGFFKIQRYQGKPPFGCDPLDNSQFTAAYFMPDDDSSTSNAPRQK